MKLANLNPATVTVIQIQSTDEYKDKVRSNAAERVLNGCILYLRGDFTVLDEAITQAGRQAETAHTAWREFIREGYQARMKWRPSGPSTVTTDSTITGPDQKNDFIKLVTQGNTTINLYDGSATMNCWEAILIAAILDKKITVPTNLAVNYQDPANFAKNIVGPLASKRHNYQPNALLGRPIAGDVVLFDNLAHVTLATGRVTTGPVQLPAVAGTNVISFWPAPTVEQFGPGATANVVETTIEAIDAWRGRNYPAMTLPVTFGSPLWHQFQG
jgi:hypothetical protein